MNTCPGVREVVSKMSDEELSADSKIAKERISELRVRGGEPISGDEATKLAEALGTAIPEGHRGA